jgi:hypothetical protein
MRCLRTIAPGGLVSQVEQQSGRLARTNAFVPGANGTTTAPFDYGQYPGVQFMAGGTNALNYQQLRAAIVRVNFLSHINYKLSDQRDGCTSSRCTPSLHSTNIGAQRRDGGGLGAGAELQARQLLPEQRA